MPSIDKPFGDPDGSNTNPNDLMTEFVEFSTPWGGLSLNSDDPSARVIVGRKGSGKTVYLRRLQISANSNSSRFARPVERDIPPTRSIVEFNQTFRNHNLVELWTDIWRKAIFRSLASLFMFDPIMSANLSTRVVSKLTNQLRPILSRNTSPVTVYSQVQEIINRFHGWDNLDNFLQNPVWGDLEWEIGELMKNSPPIFLYVDAMDEEYERAPKIWLSCQLGLFYQVFRLLRNEQLGGRLHVVVAIRELVYASVMQSEHRTRYFSGNYTRVLNWDYDAIRYFFNRKIEALDPKYFVGNSSGEKNISSWLGVSKIRNMNRKITENIDDYLIRHTRLLPRDIVILGNRLINELQNNLMFQNKPVDDVIRRTVSEVATHFGAEQIGICAGQIASNTMPMFADKHDISDIYLSNEDYLSQIARELTRLIHNSKYDRFDASSLQKMRETGRKIFGDSADIPSVLWQNGLLGFVKMPKVGKPENVFLSEARLADLHLPLDQEQYVFHSCLIESARISGLGNIPVQQFP